MPTQAAQTAAATARGPAARFKLAAAAAAAALPLLASPVKADLTLTQAGADLGFQLSIFAKVNPGNTLPLLGPYGVAVVSGGQSGRRVLVGQGGDGISVQGQVWVFSNSDNQSGGTALGSQLADVPNIGAYASDPKGLIGYGSTVLGGSFVQFNNDGSVANPDLIPGYAASRGLWTNQTNGHLIGLSDHGLIDFDPITHNVRVIDPNTDGDGVTVSPDGKYVYRTNNGGTIFGYDVATGQQKFVLNQAAGDDPDGLGVITCKAMQQGQTCVLDGDIITNNNGDGNEFGGSLTAGNVGLIDPIHNTYTIIASGGTRGDYISLDPTNGSVFLSTADNIYRLSCGAGCGIGTSAPTPVLPTDVAEPQPIAVLGFALAGIAVLRRRTSD